jgi:hypothetical protein
MGIGFRSYSLVVIFQIDIADLALGGVDTKRQATVPGDA